VYLPACTLSLVTSIFPVPRQSHLCLSLPDKTFQIDIL
jgi:hypothetical protein